MIPFPTTVIKNLSESLDEALKIPRASQPAAEFLFTSLLKSTFHPTYALPPGAFSTSLPVLSSRTTDLERSPLDPPAPQDATVPPHALSLGTQVGPNTVREEKHGLLVPVAAHPPFSLGYVLVHSPQDEASSSSISAIDVFPTTFVARFAINTITSDMICVTLSARAGCVGIRALNVHANDARKLMMLSVPALDYGPHNLPSSALWCASNMDYPSMDTTRSSSSHLLDIPNTVLSSLPTLQANASKHVPPLTVLKLRDSASPSLPPHTHTAALIAFTRAHFGVYYSPMIRVDFALGPASVTSCNTTLHDFLPESSAAKLRKFLADMYYAAVLSVSPDAPLMIGLRQGTLATLSDLTDGNASNDNAENTRDTMAQDVKSHDFIDSSRPTVTPLATSYTSPTSASQADEPLALTKSIEPTKSESRKQSLTATTISLGVRPLAKRIQPRPVGMGLAVVTVQPKRTRPKTQGESAEVLAERERKRIARRERNRLSAARSNERRRLMLEGLKTDIATEQERARELVERLRIVTAENADLRQKLVKEHALVRGNI